MSDQDGFEVVARARAASDADLAASLQDFASWPTRPQAVALEALVAAHGAVTTERVRRHDEHDYLRVTWSVSGALLDSQGDPVEPSDPRELCLQMPLDVVRWALGHDATAAALEALRTKSAGNLEVPAYVNASPLNAAITQALQGHAEREGRILALLADVEAVLSVHAAPEGSGSVLNATRLMLSEMLP